MARPRCRGAARAPRGTRAGARRAGAGGSSSLTPRRAAASAGGALLLVYLVTLAPGVTFWDAGEFISAAHVFGIPHPPGTPLYVALGRVWTLALGGVLGVARAMNLLSAVSTALAAALTAWLVARETKHAWGALTGVLCAGLMLTAWANATETEVYAISLLHVVLMLVCGALAGAGREEREVHAPRATRAEAHPAADNAFVAPSEARGMHFTLLLAYLIALAPAVHLSALVGAPAAIALAARRDDGTWRVDRVLLLGGVLVIAAGVGRMSPVVVALGAAIVVASLVRGRRASVPATLALAGVAASALLIMLVRARFDPAVNQGNPSTLAALADVVARRQYDVAPLWPRRAPLWLQGATLGQYVDWQFAWTWGHGIFATPWRSAVTFAFACLGVMGWNSMRRDARRVADALTILLACGSVGVAVYLNLKSGASIGYGFVDAGAHEARERDYFFVLAFWSWGILTGYGAADIVARRRWPVWTALAVPLIPLVANWTATDRPRGEGATAPRDVAMALLSSAPKNAVLFVAGDNDTYPLWYFQRVEGVRQDVTTVTIPLLPAGWYADEIGRRTGLRWPASGGTLAGRIAEAALASGRPVAASPSLTAAERSSLGSSWTVAGSVYLAHGRPDGSLEAPVFVAPPPPAAPRLRPTRSRLPDDVSAAMLELLQCGHLGPPGATKTPLRDSLEVTCNFR